MRSLAAPRLRAAPAVASSLVTAALFLMIDETKVTLLTSAAFVLFVGTYWTLRGADYLWHRYVPRRG